MKWIGTAIALASICFVTVTHAERIVSPPGAAATIDDGEGNSRLLLAWNPPTNDEHVTINRATLRFNLAGEPENRSLRIRLYPITSSWSPATADWVQGWSRPGGDFNEEVWSHATIELNRGPHAFVFDVTNVVKEVMEEGYAPHGFLITAEPAERIGLADDDIGRFAALGDGSIEVSWRRVPPAPRATGEIDGQ